MKSLVFRSRKDFQEFLEDEKEEMYTTIWKAIDEAHGSGRREAYVAEIYLEEEGVYIDMTSEMHEWEGSLSLALNYFASEEQYEICAKIKALIDSIEKTI